MRKYQVVVIEEGKDDLPIGKPFDNKAQAHDFCKDLVGLLNGMEYGKRWPEIKEIKTS